MSDILDRIKAECEKSHCKDCPFDGGKGYCWFNDVPAEWNIPAIRAALTAPATGVDVECPGGSQCKVWPGGYGLCIRHPHLEQFTTEPDGEYIESEALDNVIAALSDSTTPADGCEGVINEIRCDCGCGTMYACRVDLNGHGIQLCCTKCGAVVRWIPDTPKEGDTA